MYVLSFDNVTLENEYNFNKWQFLRKKVILSKNNLLLFAHYCKKLTASHNLISRCQFLVRKSSACSNPKMKSRTAVWIPSGQSGCTSYVVRVVSEGHVSFQIKVIYRRLPPPWSTRSSTWTLCPKQRWVDAAFSLIFS